MLKKLTLPVLLCAIALVNFNCKKECKVKPISKEVDQMLAFVTTHAINATSHSSGIMYEIIDPGSGANVTSTSKIVITYVGKFLSGEIFDQQTVPNNTQINPPWALTDLIEGWKIGIPLIKAGGSIRLIVPSSLAYGCEQYYEIPGNSILYFEIQLIEVQ